MGKRKDWWAVKNCDKMARSIGAEGVTAKKWQRLPFIELRAEATRAVDLSVYPKGATSMWILRRRVFDEFVCYLSMSDGAIACLVSADDNGASLCAAIKVDGTEKGDVISMVCADSVGSDKWSISSMVFPDGATMGPEEIQEAWSQVQAEVMAAVLYLAQIPGGLVECMPRLSGIERRINAKTIKKKPWARSDLSTHIVIEPGKEAEYGQPRSVSDTGRSVTPHRRRGHWVALRSERFSNKRGQRVWRRPAWVGPREWVSAGRAYRVVGHD